MKFPDHFSAHAGLYVSARPSYPPALFDWIASIAPARHCVWDCGCGNGQAAVALAQRFDAVEASDASAPQVALAQADPRVRYSVAPAEAPLYADAAFDAVCVAQALHWFDRPRFWPQVQRVLRPGGVFVAWGYDANRIAPAIDAIFEAAVLAPLTPFWPAQNALLWSGYRDIDFPFEPIATPAFEIRIDWTLDEFLAYIATWSATRQALVADPTLLASAREQLLPAWGDPDQVRPVRMPLHVRAGRRRL